VRQQHGPAVLVESGEPVPEPGRVLGQVRFHASWRSATALAERLSLRSAACTGKEDMPHRHFKTAVPHVVPKGVETELVKKRRHRDVWVLRDRVAQRERPMRGQLDQQPLGQWRDGVVLVFRGQGFAADGDDGTMHGGCSRGGLLGGWG
jgi:hypothetical protein